MNLAEFRIGEEFWCGGKRWRCTDIGTRVAVAICLEPHTVTSFEPAKNTESTGRCATDDPSWSNGPPFAVVEHVFDEYDIEGCLLTSDDDGSLEPV